jgi:hypothetical protein
MIAILQEKPALADQASAGDILQDRQHDQVTTAGQKQGRGVAFYQAGLTSSQNLENGKGYVLAIR